MSSFKKILILIITALSLSITSPVSAHDAAMGGSKWCFGKNGILATIELGLSLFPQMKGIKEGGYNLDASSDEQLQKIAADIIQPYISGKLSISVNDKAYPVKVNKVVREDGLWKIWLSIDNISFRNAVNPVKIDYRLLFEEVGNTHVNMAYMYLSDASAEAVQKVFDYTHPVAQHIFNNNATAWEVTIKGTASEQAATAPIPASPASPAAGAGAISIDNNNPTPVTRQKNSALTTAADKITADPLSSDTMKTATAAGNQAVDLQQASDNSSSPGYANSGAVIPNNSAGKSVWANIGQFITLGIEHILIGYDHIAFLLALIVIGLSVREVLKIITAFTVAHSITLLLAAMQIVSLNSRLVESVIALSICYVAMENLFKKEVNYRWLVTFCFGLIHGFGFASVLQDFIVGKSNLVLSVLSFNFGVEIGQLLIILVMLPILHLLKNMFEFRRITAGASVAIFILGFTWLVERVFDLKLIPI